MKKEYKKPQTYCRDIAVTPLLTDSTRMNLVGGESTEQCAKESEFFNFIGDDSDL